jgi:Fe-S cluster assembly protein SufD
MAEQKGNILINRLPARTWNRLGVNYASVAPAIDAGQAGGVVYTARNEEQTIKEIRPSGDAAKWADTFSKGIRREAFPAGKNLIYQDQVFQSGLGGEFTDLMEELAPETTVYTIEEGKKLTEPVVLSWDFQKGGSAAAQQIIHAKKGSESTFLMSLSSEREADGEAAFLTKVILEEDAIVHLMKVSLIGKNMVLYDDSAAVIGDNALFDFTQLELGGGRTYAGCCADEYGTGADFHVNTGYMADENHLMDINYIAVQRGERTNSRIYVKGSLKDKARKIFRGTIDFRNGAKGSVGDEQEDVLLLDPGVVNKTVPVILNEEEDVDGRHGATIGNLSEDILYYLGTRGIGKDAAEMLMTRGRLLSIAHLIPDEDTVSKISSFIREAFETNE